MKNFLKVAIIILLVLAAVGGTTYFFFKYNDKKDVKTGSIVKMLESDSNINFKAKLTIMNKLVNQDGTDNRMEIIIATNEKLDEIVYNLSSYFVDSNTVVTNAEIKKQYDKINSDKSLLNDMIREYYIKTGYDAEKDEITPTFLEEHMGLNDFYKQVSLYLVNYAKFANLLNNHVSNVNKNADIKFAVFDLYTNVVQDTFTDITTNANNWIVVKDTANLVLLNNEIDISYSYIVTEKDGLNIPLAYTSTANNFVKYYNLSDKQKLAENLATNSTIAKSENQETNDLIATYYFNVLFGII